MSDFINQASLMVAKSQLINTRIRQDYPRISELLEYNRSGTIGFLKANDGYTITHMFEVPYTGYDDGRKVWNDYRIETLSKIKNKGWTIIL